MNLDLIKQRVEELRGKKEKTVLITGAAGFIGSNLSHLLLNNTSYRVIGLDAMLEGSSRKNLPPLSDRFAFHHYDLRGNLFRELSNIYHEIDYVVHLAAESHVDRSFSQSENFWGTQVQGTRNLCEFAVDMGHPIFLNQITDEVYPSLFPVSETFPFSPTSPYACSKAAQYYVGRSFLHTWNLPVISSFPCNTFGPRQFPEKLVPKFLTLLRDGEKVPLMKSSHFSREWLSVMDHCKALLFLMNNGVPGESYNVGPGHRMTNKQMTEELLLLTGRDESYIRTVPDRIVHDESYSIDCSKLKKLGWHPQDNFHDYLEMTSKWYC